MTGHVTGGDDEIMMDSQPRDAPHKGHDSAAWGASFTNDVDDCFAIAKHGDSSAMPAVSPNVAGDCNRKNFIEGRRKIKL